MSAVEDFRTDIRRRDDTIDELRARNTELAADVEQHERYEAGLRGEIQQLTERATLAEAKVQDLTAVAQGAGNAVERLRADNDQLKQQVKSLLTTLTQDECHCDPPGSGEEFCTGGCLLRDEIARLKAVLSDAMASLKMAEMYVRIDGLPEEVRQFRASIELIESCP